MEIAGLRGAVNHFLLSSKPTDSNKITKEMDETDCLWRAFMWNDFPNIVTDCL